MVKQKKEPDIMESRHRRAKHGGSRSKNKKKHRVLKIIGFIVLFLVLISGVMLGKAYMDVKKVSDKSYQAIDRTTQAKLPSLKAKSPFSFLFLGINGKSVNDILVLTMNPKQDMTTVVSLNRDIYLTSESATINEVYSKKGVSGTIDALQKLLGTDIPKYMTFDMSGLGDFVTAVGGIKIQNETHFISNGYEFKPGTLTLEKKDEVNAFLTQVGEDTKKAENSLIEREQAVLMAVIPKMKSKDTILKYNQFLNAFGSNIKTDFVFGNLKALGLHYSGVLGNINKENLKTSKTMIDGKDQKILTEDQVNKAHDKIQSALSE